jgi:hypothetical protein
MEHIVKNLEHKENSTSGHSVKGSSLEGPQIGAPELKLADVEGRESSM